MRRTFLLALLCASLCVASTAKADVVLDDFEGGALDGRWVPNGVSTALSSAWASTGSQSLAVTPNNQGFTWALQFNDLPAYQLLTEDHTLAIDVYFDASEWTDNDGDSWVKWDVASVNGGGPSGWQQLSPSDPANPTDPGIWNPNDWGPTHQRTLTYDWTGINYDNSGATWGQFNISVNMGNLEGIGTMYIDNVRLIAPIPEPAGLGILFGLTVAGLARRRR